jgi:hypothetical protein
MVNTGDIRFAAFLCSIKAEQSHQIAVIRMEELPSSRPVNTDFIDLRRVVADVFDVPQHVAAAVLADEIAQMCAETHVCDGVLKRRPFAGGEALEEDEAFAVQEVLSQVLQDRSEDGETEDLLWSNYQSAL